jgi:hypothetical protein
MAPFWIGCHFEISINEISYIILRHFQNVFIYLNRMKNAKTIGQNENVLDGAILDWPPF